MNNEVRKELEKAKKFYKNKQYCEALDIFEKNYSENPSEFKEWDRIFYSWSIYQTDVKNPSNEDQLFESAERVTELIKQVDLNNNSTCPYTFTVFRVLDYLYKNNDFAYLVKWLDKIDFKLLDSKPSRFNGRLYPSRKEKYFNYSSKAYLECKDYEKCIQISSIALDELDTFTNYNDIWHKWRIAKSLKELNQSEEALNYLKEVYLIKQDWFIPKEIAENYFILDDKENALNYIADAILTDDPVNIKVNLFYLIYQIFKEEQSELALKHAKLYAAIKINNNVTISSEIEELLVDNETLDIDLLESEIKEYWLEFRYKNQELQRGTIRTIFEHGKSGFIKSDDNQLIYFNTREFKSDISTLIEGQTVSFYTKKGFNKSKNRESINAVNINTL